MFRSWDKRHEFFFNCLLYVVGMGNLWRLPYIVHKNGGGTFLIPYALSLSLIGIPYFFLEVALGQFASLGPISIWRVSPAFKGVGYGMVVAGLVVSVYYNTLIAWSIFYLFASLTSPLPWSWCNPEWATTGCVTSDVAMVGDNFTSSSLTVEQLIANATLWTENLLNSSHYVGTLAVAAAGGNASAVLENIPLFDTNLSLFMTTTPNSQPPSLTFASEQYFRHKLLRLTPDVVDEVGPPGFHMTLALLGSWVLVFIILTTGLKSTAKCALTLTPFPLLMLVVILARSCLLDGVGAAMGLRYFFIPQWNKLAESSVWIDAVVHVFFTLSCLKGGLMTLASYNPFDLNCLRLSILIPVCDLLVSSLLGCAVFASLGVMAHNSGQPVNEVLNGSMALTFIVLSQAVLSMPFPSVWSAAFFFLLVCLGISSQYVLIEAFTTAVTDEWRKKLGKRKVLVTAITCLSLFLLGLPLVTRAGLQLVTIMDATSNGFVVLLLGFLFAVALGWVYTSQRLCDDVSFMLGFDGSKEKALRVYFAASLKYFTPVLLVVALLVKAFVLAHKAPLPTAHKDFGVVTPSTADALSYILTFGILLPVPIVFGIELWSEHRKGCPLPEALSAVLRPARTWGPALTRHRALLMRKQATCHYVYSDRIDESPCRQSSSDSDDYEPQKSAEECPVEEVQTPSTSVSSSHEPQTSESYIDLPFRTDGRANNGDAIFISTTSVGTVVPLATPTPALSPAPSRQPCHSLTGHSILQQYAEEIDVNNKVAQSKRSSRTKTKTGCVKVDRDMHGLDSMFSATVGANVLLPMALRANVLTCSAAHQRSQSSFAGGSSTHHTEAANLEDIKNIDGESMTPNGSTADKSTQTASRVVLLSSRRAEIMAKLGLISSSSCDKMV